MPVSSPELPQRWPRTYLSTLPFFIPLLLALLLLVILHHLKSSPPTINSDCTADQAICLLLGDILRDVSSLGYDLRRQDVDKQELPVLQIYLTNGALKKLYRKRRETLDKPGQILLSEDDDWVQASLIADDGRVTPKLNAQLRLKGDWVDHIIHKTKLSFRIKIQKEGYIFGMKRFSIQHTATRRHQAEILLLNEMRRWGILAPRYRLVDVRINDYRIGIMALEEHFSKELLESQQRREGPIIVLDEDLWWRQKDLSARYGSTVPNPENAPPLTVSPVLFVDLPVKQFRAPLYMPGTIATHNSVRAMSLYRDFMDGTLGPESVFDLRQLARWWVLTNVWNGCHGVQAPNRRFYFNPTTGLLEPIAFDNVPRPETRSERKTNCDPLVAIYLLDNKNFEHYVRQFSKTLMQSYRDPLWQKQFRDYQSGLIKLLARDNIKSHAIEPQDLVKNLTTFVDTFEPVSLQRVISQRETRFSRSYPDAPYYSHIRAFLFPSDGGMTLELKNLTNDEIDNIRIRVRDDTFNQSIANANATLPRKQPAQGDRYLHIKQVHIDRPFSTNTSVTINYDFRGATYSKTATVQFRDHDTGYSKHFLTMASDKSHISLDPIERTISFGKGQHLFENSMELDQGWSVTLEAGAELMLTDGATLKINGPLFILGNRREPVRISMTPSPNFRQVGAWGGILVSQSARRSKVEHAVISGGSSQTLVNRQDFYGVTGCLSFYESDVDIRHTTFDQLHCEDALNIVRADFTIRDTSFQGARADSFDSDFSKGTILDSVFKSTGNDAVDISGTELSMTRVRFYDIGDKAVSVGEQSLLNATKLAVNRASTGIASKDLSVARVVDSDFENIAGSALITYVKKSEYGRAAIHCDNCTFNNTKFVATNQHGSEISINGASQPFNNFNQIQLGEAGFVTEQ